MSCVTCHVSHVTCHMSRATCHVAHVMCHMSSVTCHIYFFWQSGEAYRWRVCFQRGLPRLVFKNIGNSKHTSRYMVTWVSPLQACAEFDKLVTGNSSLNISSGEDIPVCHRCSAVQGTAVQCSAVQCSVIQCIAIQCSAGLRLQTPLPGRTHCCSCCWCWAPSGWPPRSTTSTRLPIYRYLRPQTSRYLQTLYLQVVKRKGKRSGVLQE